MGGICHHGIDDGQQRVDARELLNTAASCGNLYAFGWIGEPIALESPSDAYSVSGHAVKWLLREE